MKYPKAYTDYIKSLAELFQKKLSLLEYQIWLHHKPAMKSKRYANGYSAEVQVDTRYLDIHITLTDKLYSKWKEGDLKWIAVTICHELSHIYTDPYYEFLWEVIPEQNKEALQHINETATQRICNLVMLHTRPEEYLPKRKKK